MTTGDHLKWEVVVYFAEAPFPPSPPPAQKKNNGGIVGLLWMNQRQHCVEGGEGEVERLYVGKSAKCPIMNTSDQDCSKCLSAGRN